MNDWNVFSSADASSAPLLPSTRRADLFPSSRDIGPDRLLIFHLDSIPNRGRRNAVYEKVRGNWKVCKDRAAKADYIIAVHAGRTQGVYVPDGPEGDWNWRPSYNPDEEGRWQFDGKMAPPDVWEKYVGRNGKRIIERRFRPSRNPFRYVNI
jgi:hypothetical protein